MKDGLPVAAPRWDVGRVWRVLCPGSGAGRGPAGQVGRGRPRRGVEWAYSGSGFTHYYRTTLFQIRWTARLMGPPARVLLRALSRALHSRLVGCSTAALGKVGERDSDALEEDVAVEAPSHE
jgi:hypothetical protein